MEPIGLLTRALRFFYIRFSHPTSWNGASTCFYKEFVLRLGLVRMTESVTHETKNNTILAI
jgi:hypothetical protein